LVPKSVTLNDHERRNDRFLRYFTEFSSFGGQLRQSAWLKVDLHTACGKNAVQRI